MTFMNHKSIPPSSNVRLVSLIVRTALITSSFFIGVAQAADLREVYKQAKTYDAEYLTAQFNLDAASRRVPLAKSAFRPQLTFGANAGLGIRDNGTDNDGDYRDTALTLTLSQSLYNRSDKKLIDQAQLGALQADAQYAAVGQTLILRVATSYFDVLRARASLQFSQSELQAISRQKDQAERRFDVGLVPITDVRSAQAQYDLAIAQEIAAAACTAAPASWARAPATSIASSSLDRMASTRLTFRGRAGPVTAGAQIRWANSKQWQLT